MMSPLDYTNYKEEKIDGKIRYMSPMANPKHGETIGNLYAAFHPYFKGKTCKVFPDNISVFLDDEKNNYVVPDISVLCNPSQFKNNGYHGVPSFVVEVISHPRV
ncbi:MAG: Uma2 family endonuclease [Cellulosilyticaceae bacterium]